MVSKIYLAIFNYRNIVIIVNYDKLLHFTMSSTKRTTIKIKRIQGYFQLLPIVIVTNKLYYFILYYFTQINRNVYQ